MSFCVVLYFALSVVLISELDRDTKHCIRFLVTSDSYIGGEEAFETETSRLLCDSSCKLGKGA